jgi:hypothetical protein
MQEVRTLSHRRRLCLTRNLSPEPQPPPDDNLTTGIRVYERPYLYLGREQREDDENAATTRK